MNNSWTRARLEQLADGEEITLGGSLKTEGRMLTERTRLTSAAILSIAERFQKLSDRVECLEKASSEAACKCDKHAKGSR